MEGSLPSASTSFDENALHRLDSKRSRLEKDPSVVGTFDRHLLHHLHAQELQNSVRNVRGEQQSGYMKMNSPGDDSALGSAKRHEHEHERPAGDGGSREVGQQSQNSGDMSFELSAASMEADLTEGTKESREKHTHHRKKKKKKESRSSSKHHPSSKKEKKKRRDSSRRDGSERSTYGDSSTEQLSQDQSNHIERKPMLARSEKSRLLVPDSDFFLDERSEDLGFDDFLKTTVVDDFEMAKRQQLQEESVFAPFPVRRSSASEADEDAFNAFFEKSACLSVELEDFATPMPTGGPGNNTQSSFSAHTPKTEKTSKTAETMTSLESFENAFVANLPPAQIEVDSSGSENKSKTEEDFQEMAEFHGEMLETFLKRHGQDEKLALATALAFETFLKKQQSTSNLADAVSSEPSTSLLSGKQSSSSQDSSNNKDDLALDDDDFLEVAARSEERTLGGDEFSMTGDSFAADSAWENGTFCSYPAKNKQKKPSSPQDKMDDAASRDLSTSVRSGTSAGDWGKVRRNETFMRQRGGLQRESSGRIQERSQTSEHSASTRMSISSSVKSQSTAEEAEADESLVPPNLLAKAELMTQSSSSASASSAHFQKIASLQRETLGMEVGMTEETRPFYLQIESLTLPQRTCVINLKTRWEKRRDKKFKLTDDWYLRFARCSPVKPFSEEAAYKVMKNMDARYANLSIQKLKKQMLTKTLFPCPGLKSNGGHDMFYMNQSRFSPKDNSMTAMMDNLVYVMQCMLEKEQAAEKGIGFIANMTDMKMTNFSVPYCHKLLQTLQGRRCPTKVELFLIVNPPSWFGSIWSIMKPMLGDDFQQNVHIVTIHGMKNFLASGYEAHLPDDIASGRAATGSMVGNFIEERKQKEASR
eukprot:CAMPEP_0194047186 /NCGR_PEP_ID=MMETSP0009_2-20130614/23607_1 /TAXON_ID=210454 /ORGANISM="Grammatophora oceanica, Strain CCMP 410" /LENGTH=874 /DNA_ID=CAMNT_0038692723 /DNA_START=6 /DNA_END=2630 /DNA_ORIENTATION=+